MAARVPAPDGVAGRSVPETLTDAQIAAAIDAQLKQAGIQARVTVTNGEVKIEKAP